MEKPKCRAKSFSLYRQLSSPLPCSHFTFCSPLHCSHFTFCKKKLIASSLFFFHSFFFCFVLLFCLSVEKSKCQAKSFSLYKQLSSPLHCSHYSSFLAIVYPDRKVRRDKEVREKLDKIRKLGPLNWPVVSEHLESCYPPCPIMGKPNCSFARYADQFVNSGEPAVTAPIPENAGGSSRNKLVVGVRKDVRITQTAERAEANAASVTAARAAKAPVDEAGKRRTSSIPSPRKGGPSHLLPSGDTSRKRTSRESFIVEPSVAQERLGLGPEGADYRFSYNYPNKGLAFTLDEAACAKLASKIPGGFTQLPSPDSLSESSSYTSWARDAFKMIGAVNHLADDYERIVKKAEKAESEARASYVKERKKADSYRKDSETSASELKSFKEMFDTETARLRASRDSCAKAEKEKADGFRVYGDRLRRHILSQEAAKKDLELLTQITGTKECLEGLMRVGVPIPEEKMKQLADDEARYRDIVNQFNIVDLLGDDLAEPTAGGHDRAPADQ